MKVLVVGKIPFFDAGCDKVIHVDTPQEAEDRILNEEFDVIVAGQDLFSETAKQMIPVLVIPSSSIEVENRIIVERELLNARYAEAKAPLLAVRAVAARLLTQLERRTKP